MQEFLQRVCETLRNGGVILHATETCYGFACDATNPRAVEKLYCLKKMPFSKPSSVMVSSYEAASLLGQFSDSAGVLAEEYWPGPLTLIVPRTDAASASLTGPGSLTGSALQHFLGIRVPGHAWTLALLREYKKPLITTSANIHGQPECYDVPCVLEQLNCDDGSGKPDCIVDHGALLDRQKPSTIIQFLDDRLLFIREGPLGKEILEKYFQYFKD